VTGNISDYDWSTYAATEHAVIAFARRDEEILLIHKKRGLGAGKINGPGGRLEGRERPYDAAIRETQEEVGLTLHDPTESATLRFVFLDGYRLTVTVFVAWVFEGVLVETDEAIPFWTPVASIPWERMWADDRHWLPEVLADRYVEGRFVFDGDSMLFSAVEVRDR
jgi:8-oxo-dGTP diphosphatase